MESKQEGLKGQRFSKGQNRPDEEQGKDQGNHLRPVGDSAGTGQKAGGAVGDRSAVMMGLPCRGIESTKGSKDEDNEIDRGEKRKHYLLVR